MLSYVHGAISSLCALMAIGPLPLHTLLAPGPLLLYPWRPVLACDPLDPWKLILFVSTCVHGGPFMSTRLTCPHATHLLTSPFPTRTQFLLASLSSWRGGLSLLTTPVFVCLLVVAFLVAFNQNKALIGDRGLLPCRLYLKNVQQYFQSSTGWSAWTYSPTIMWLLDWSDMNFNLDLLALLGLGLSSFVLVTGCANMILMAALWALYMSLVNVGQIW